MQAEASAQSREDAFRIERHGAVAIIVPSRTVESWNWNIIEDAAEIVLQPLRDESNPQIVIDLTHVSYFGSVFLALLLRMWKIVVGKGGQMVLAGASANTKELLAVTALDTIWPIYDAREEAVRVLLSED